MHMPVFSVFFFGENEFCLATIQGCAFFGAYGFGCTHFFIENLNEKENTKMGAPHFSVLGLPLWLSWERSKVKVFQSCPALCDPVDIPSMEFSTPEDWSG